MSQPLVGMLTAAEGVPACMRLQSSHPPATELHDQFKYVNIKWFHFKVIIHMLSTKSLLLAAVLSFAACQAEASYLKVDFSIDSSKSPSNEYSYGTPFGYPGGPIVLAGTAYLIPGDTSASAFAAFDLTVGSKTLTAADIDRSRSGPYVYYNSDSSFSQFGFILKDIGNFYTNNTISISDQTNSFYCNYCVSVDKVTEVNTVSAVPLPASAPLFGTALLALGGLAYGLNRREALRALLPAA